MKTALQLIVLSVVLVLMQLLVCNNIVLFNVAIPIVFIYVIIWAPLWLNQSLLLTIAFLLGLIVDIGSDTPGMNSLACTLLAMLKRPVYYAYTEHDDHSDEVTPSLSSMGVWDYCKYLLTMVAIYCILIFSIEYFSFADVKEIAMMAGYSTAITFLLLIGIDSIMKGKREKRL